MRKLFFLFALLMLWTLPAVAEKNSQISSSGIGKRRGMITSSQCPYSCKHERLPANLCRDWQVGNTCYVEDYTQVPGHRTMVRVPLSDFKSPAELAQMKQLSQAKDGARKSGLQKTATRLPLGKRRGLITSTTCPYTCRDAGLSSDLCRESRVGNVCRIEDFTQVPGHRTLVRIPQR